ncbi:ninein [Gastrophryne carolinensis]
MEQDQYEAHLKELFDSFDTTGTGSLGQEELTDLCHMLQLEEVAPDLQQALLQDNPHGRVHFDQFKEALIDVLSNTVSNKENCPEPDCSIEVQPKYIKDGKRYGRRTVPELQDSLEDFEEETVIQPEDEGTRSSQVSSRNCEELWKSEEGEEYEAEGQLRFWNPDDPNASQSTLSPEQDWVEEKLQLICEDLGITRDGHLNRKKLLSICEQYGFQNLDKEALEDALQNAEHEDTMSLQDFFNEVCKNTKPPTPSSSTPYRQLKRHLSLQPYDDSGRRNPSAMSGTLGLRLFSKFDDGSGYGSVEDIMDMWQEEGLDNSQVILKTLDFSLEGKINLSELTMTLENELLITKNEIFLAALISFRSEIRHLNERTDQSAKEKEKLRLDLEKNEKLKSLMASEVDDHHAAIERRNEHNLRKLDEEYKERTSALKSELRKEREQILQQANWQRLNLEQELEKVKVEENYLRDRLTLCIKENTRLESELLETTEKLVDCEALTAKLQRNIDNILREKFGDLDPSCVEFFRHEERLLQVRNEYERQRRELQDRIDELQLELENYRTQGGRGFRSSLKNSLFDEMDNKNSVEYDQGIGSEDPAPLNMSIEAEMAIEQMREQHQREVDQLTLELDSKTMHYEETLKEAKCSFEKEQEALKEKLNNDIHKAEEHVKIFKQRHLELEAEIQRLKNEHQKMESELQEQVREMKAECNLQRLQLVEKEAALQKQLEEYHKEKEELVQRAEDIEKMAEARMVELVTTYEEKRNNLEQTFQEQISNFQERHEQEKQELRRQLLEQHQQKVQEERLVAKELEKPDKLSSLLKVLDAKYPFLDEVVRVWFRHLRQSIEIEFNERVSKMNSQCQHEMELAEKTHNASLLGLESKFQNDLQNLTEQHAEEKAQWTFEKEELIQENIDAQARLQEELVSYKKSCAELSRERDALEKTYKKMLSNLTAEKEELHKELLDLRVHSKQVEHDLTAQVLQIENDLRDELTERDELLREAEKDSHCLRKALENLEKQHKSAKGEFDSKLASSEALHQEVYKRAESRQSELLEEIGCLQNTIANLNAKITSLSNIQQTCEMFEKENLELKNIVSQLQSSLALLEAKQSALEKLQSLHERALQEKAVLVEEISNLQNPITDLNATCMDLSKMKAKCELLEKENLQVKNTVLQLQCDLALLEQKESSEIVQSMHELGTELPSILENSLVLSESKQNNANKTVKMTTIDKNERFCEAEGDFQDLESALEKLERQCKLEKDELNSKLKIAEGLYKDLCEKAAKNKSEMIEEITRLQNTIIELRHEVENLSKDQAELNLMEKENSQLKKEVSRLQEFSAILEEEICSHRNVHEQIVKENSVLQSEIARLRKMDGLVEKEENQDRVVNGQGDPCAIFALHKIVEELKRDHAEEKQILQSKLSKSEEQIKELFNSTEARKREMVVEIGRLQSTIDQLQTEIGSLSKIERENRLMKKENEDLKKEVSQLQSRISGNEERVNVLKTLQEAHENTVQENVRLLSEISDLQRRLQIKEVDNKTTDKLLNELQERTEQLCQAEKDAQLLHDALYTVEQDRKIEKECIKAKALQSEELYKAIYNENQKSKAEIANLKSAIKEFENEAASFVKVQDEHALLEKENHDLKLALSDWQNTSMFFDEGGVFRNLQTAHEQTVKDNVKLLAEVSKLQKKLLLEGENCEGQVTDRQGGSAVEADHTLTLKLEGQTRPPVLEDIPNGDVYKKTLHNVNTKLQKKTKELEDTTKVLCQLEKSYSEVKTDNDNLKTLVLSLREKLNNISLEYDQVKKAVVLEGIILPELEDTPITIPGLKLLLAVAKKENVNLQEKINSMELRHIEAIENNKSLSTEVALLHKEIQNMEEITEASLKLENLYVEAKKENDELKMLVQEMQKKKCLLETEVGLRNKKVQTIDQKIDVKSSNLKCSPRGPTHQKEKIETLHMSNGMEEMCTEKSTGLLMKAGKIADLGATESFSKAAGGNDGQFKGDPQVQNPCCLEENECEGRSKMRSRTAGVQKNMDYLRFENKNVKGENAALTAQLATLKEETESSNQKVAELLDTCEEMWLNLETIQNEKFALEKMVAELKSRNEQLAAENEELFQKNTKNQEDLQDLNRRLVAFLKQKDRKDSTKGLEEWQKEKGQMGEEISGYRSKLYEFEQELSQIKVRGRFLEQENTLLRQEIETKQLAKCSEITDLKNEISLLLNKNEKLLKEKETLTEELSNCVAKSANMSSLENKLSSLKQEQKTWEQKSHSLRSQLTVSQDKIKNLEESLQSANLQMSRIKSDLRVAQQEKESLKQEVMSLHKQLQNANTKKQVLEMAIQSSGLQNQHKKQYWDDLERLMEQEQQLFKQENERLQREVLDAKADLAQTREKVRQLESTVISLKHQKQSHQSSLVKALEQEKSSLRRECDQLQMELASAHWKITQLSSHETDIETLKMDSESLRTKQGKFDDHLMEMLHSPTSLSHSHTPIQQQACATVPRDQFLHLQQQLQQAERRNQQLQAAMDNRSANSNAPQSEQESLLRKMEARMMDVEQKLRIVKLLLQEKVNQLKEQANRTSIANARIKDLYIENSQLLKALELSEQRQQTAEKKNHLLEQNISGLSKIVKDLTPSTMGAGNSSQCRP